MRLSNHQLNQLRESRIDHFRARLHRHLLETFPRQCNERGAAAVLRDIDAAMARAQAEDIRSERGIAKFIETAYRLHFGPATPDLRLWAQQTLASPDLDPVAKMDHVYQTVRDAVPLGQTAGD